LSELRDEKEKIMKHRLMLTNMLPLALFFGMASTAQASTTWYVNGLSGSDSNNCKSSTTPCKTIGHAISLAASGDSIMVAAATYKENLNIGSSINVIGSTASSTIVDGGGVNTVVTVGNSGGQVTLSQLTIRDGNYPSGGGIYNSGALRVIDSVISGNFARYWGGGIYNSGALTVINSTVTSNKVSNTCGLYCASDGGGIYNYSGTVAISNSTLSGNSVVRQCARCAAAGGGIYNLNGAIAISNSTLNGNSVVAKCYSTCNGVGGGIWNSGTLTASNTTISGNSAFGTASSLGGGIFHYDSEGSVTLQNSIVANNPSGGNCYGSVTSNGYNMSSDGTCNLSNSGDRNNTDPMLGPLQNNGGPTQTMALLPGSPAIDAGNPSGCTDGSGHLLTTDQRGYPRHDPEDTGGCDMGAYEKQSD
jgi:hypothetical protein